MAFAKDDRGTVPLSQKMTRGLSLCHLFGRNEMKTTELYYESAYITEFDATVLSCEAGGDGSFLVVLDRTAFFPEEGGQTCDRGVLTDDHGGTHRVLHVSIRDGIVSHRVGEAISEGTQVHGEIDFGHRFSNMQQHAAEHIFSGIVHSRFGYENVGFHLSDSEVTMDYSGQLTDEQITEAELAVNRAIWADIEVRCTFPSREELAAMDYRSKKELTGAIRIVEIPGYDTCACCAPHVERTGEIGLLKVIRAQNYKGGTRVSILCGERAFVYLSEEHGIVDGLARGFSTSPARVCASVERLQAQLEERKGRVADLQSRLLCYELQEIDADLRSVFLVKEADLDQNTIRKTVNGLAAAHPGFCGIFAGDAKTGYHYIIASGTEGGDAKNLQRILSEEFGAKGGGSSQMIQGSFACGDIRLVTERCGAF